MRVPVPQSESASGRSLWKEVKAGSEAFFDAETGRKPRVSAVKGWVSMAVDRWVKNEGVRLVVAGFKGW
jgi:hypothetical protein